MYMKRCDSDRVVTWYVLGTAANQPEPEDRRLHERRLKVSGILEGLHEAL